MLIPEVMLAVQHLSVLSGNFTTHPKQNAAFGLRFLLLIFLARGEIFENFVILIDKIKLSDGEKYQKG